MERPRRHRPAVVKRLLQGVENEAGVGRAADPPADNAASEDVDDERHIDEARPGGDVREVRDPQHVRARRPELAVHAVQRAWWALSLIVVRTRLPRMTPAGPLSFVGLRGGGLGDEDDLAAELPGGGELVAFGDLGDRKSLRHRDLQRAATGIVRDLL